jgi:hypothetical protein
MTEVKIQKLIDDLFSHKFTKTYSHTSDTYNHFSIDEQSRNAIENIIRSFLLDSRDEKLGALEAKVFMYEQIISKSNFAPMIEVKTVLTPKIEENDK